MVPISGERKPRCFSLTSYIEKTGKEFINIYATNLEKLKINNFFTTIIAQKIL